jgi:hypothetical protein
MKVKTVAAFDPKRPSILSVTWADGKKSEWDAADMSAEIRAQLKWHGMKQKLMDAHAATYKETGSVAECRAASQAVYETLVGGSFNSGREASPWILQAISEITDTDMEDVVEIWNGLDEKAQKAFFSDPRVRAWKAKRDLERAQAAESTLDLGAMFAKK